jgi:hypothetical protein
MADRLFPQSARFSRRTLLLASAGLALPTIVHAAPVESIAPEIPIPDTAAGRQLTWVLGQINRKAKGLGAREIRRHVAPEFLASLPANQLRSLIRTWVGPNGPLTVVRFEGGVSETRANAIAINQKREIWRIRLGASASEPFLIDALYFEPASLPAGPNRSIGDWPAFAEAFQGLAPRVSFAAAELTDDGPRLLCRLHGEQQRAIASAFKIYVLGELLRQVRAGEIGWDDPVAIQDTLRSMPNGDMRWLPAGLELPVRHFAERMTAGSDNTATDHLIGRLGRDRVEAGMAAMGHSHPARNLPLLYTREWFAMRMRLRDTQIERYLAADAGKRLRILANTVDPLAAQLSDGEPWPGPRYIDQIEWFAGGVDLVSALDWIRRHAGGRRGAPVLDALSLNPGACWHPDSWRYVGYKGGYETGVMSNVWLLQRQDERWFAFAAIINDSRREIDSAGLWRLQVAAERLLAAER